MKMQYLLRSISSLVNSVRISSSLLIIFRSRRRKETITVIPTIDWEDPRPISQWLPTDFLDFEDLLHIPGFVKLQTIIKSIFSGSLSIFLSFCNILPIVLRSSLLFQIILRPLVIQWSESNRVLVSPECIHRPRRSSLLFQLTIVSLIEVAVSPPPLSWQDSS